MYLLLVFLGACVGSWFGGITYRLQRDLPLRQWGRSLCPRCGRRLGALELLPLLGYVLLRGRCKGCGGPISLRYPFIELAYALLFAAFGALGGGGLDAALKLVGASLLLANAITDLESGYVFDLLSLYPGVAASALALVLAPTDVLPSLSWHGPALGGLAVAGFVWALRLFYPYGMGEGDAKVAFTMGAFLGWRLGLLALYLSFLLGGATGMALLTLRRVGRKTPLPFVPFMAVGYAASALVGEELLAFLTSRWWG